jgi:hypothetical protein
MYVDKLDRLAHSQARNPSLGAQCRSENLHIVGKLCDNLRVCLG